MSLEGEVNSESDNCHPPNLPFDTADKKPHTQSASFSDNSQANNSHIVMEHILNYDDEPSPPSKRRSIALELKLGNYSVTDAVHVVGKQSLPDQNEEFHIYLKNIIAPGSPCQNSLDKGTSELTLTSRK